MAGIIELRGDHAQWVPVPAPALPSYSQFKQFKQTALKPRPQFQCVSCGHLVPYYDGIDSYTKGQRDGKTTSVIYTIAVGTQIKHLEFVKSGETVLNGRTMRLDIMKWVKTPAMFRGPGCRDCQEVFRKIVGRGGQYIDVQVEVMAVVVVPGVEVESFSKTPIAPSLPAVFSGKCPECDQHEWDDSVRGRVKCPQCRTQMLITGDNLTGEKTVRLL